MDEMRRVVPFHVISRAVPLGDEALVLVHDAFEMGLAAGRREGFKECQSKVMKFFYEMLDRLELDYETVDEQQVLDFQAVFAGARPSSLVAAYFGGAGDTWSLALEAIRKLLPGPTS